MEVSGSVKTVFPNQGLNRHGADAITNYKIVSAIRNEIASRLDIDSLQEVLASHWKPYLDSLHVCMADV